MAQLEDTVLSNRLKAAQLCIFTAKSEERAIVLFYLKTIKGVKLSEEELVDNREQKFSFGTLTIDTSCVDFYVTCGFRQGVQSFAIVSSYIFQRYCPQYAIMIGICAGKGSGFDLLDVVFSCGAIQYEEGKVDEHGVLKPSTRTESCYQGVQEDVVHLLKDSDRPFWKEAIMLSGCAVLEKAAELFDRIGTHVHRDAKALDMEASAFFASCRYHSVKALPVIKAVSDFADGNKNDNVHQKCLQRATEAAVAFLFRYFKTRSFAVNESGTTASADVDQDAARWAEFKHQEKIFKDKAAELQDKLMEKIAALDSDKQWLPVNSTECLVIKKTKGSAITLEMLVDNGIESGVIQAMKQTAAAKISEGLAVNKIRTVKRRKTNESFSSDAQPEDY